MNATLTEQKINRSLFVEGRLWTDKTFGNTYFSARVWVDGQIVAILPFQYGYESHYQSESMKKLFELGYITEEYAKRGAHILRDDFGIDYYYTKTNTKKSEMFVQGKYYEEMAVA
jgi:hypothetical protein